MNHYLSDKIKILSFVLILLVLYIHSGFHADEIRGMNVNHFLQEFISGKIGRLAVPLFFMISGYLFFLNTENGITSIKRKIQSRVRTLLFPYFYGCIFFVLFLAFVSFIPGVGKYMNGNIFPLLEKPLPKILVDVFWIAEGGNTPMAFQLWFLRDLIILVALTPILYYVLNFLKWWALPVLFALSYLTVIPESLLSSLFWFASGGVFAVTKSSVVCHKSLRGIVVFILYLLLSFWEQLTINVNFEPYQKILIIFGLIGVWSSYDYFVKPDFNLKDKGWLSVSCSFTFFIYLFHEPTLNIVRKVVVILIGKNSTGYLISYLSSPILFAIFTIFAGNILKKNIPNTYDRLVGGRS